MMAVERNIIERSSSVGTDDPGATILKDTTTMSDTVPDDLELSEFPAIPSPSPNDMFAGKSEMNSAEIGLNVTATIAIDELPVVRDRDEDEEKDEDYALEHDEIGLNPIEDADTLDKITRNQNTNCCDEAVEHCLVQATVSEELVEKVLCRADRALCTCEVTDWVEKTTGYALCGDKDNVIEASDDETKSIDESLLDESLAGNDDSMTTGGADTSSKAENTLKDLTIKTAGSQASSTTSKKKRFLRWKNKNKNQAQEEQAENQEEAQEEQAENQEEAQEEQAENQEEAQEEQDNSKVDVVPGVLPSTASSVNSSTIEKENEASDLAIETTSEEDEPVNESPGGVVLTKIPSEIEAVKLENPTSDEVANESSIEKIDNQDYKSESLRLQKTTSFDSLSKKEEEESGFECVLQRKISLRVDKAATGNEETAGRSVVTPSPVKEKKQKGKKSQLLRLGKLTRKMTFRRTPSPLKGTTSTGSTFAEA
eukprot:jgi/Psemu1/284922/fgenesh1_pg.68_\